MFFPTTRAQRRACLLLGGAVSALGLPLSAAAQEADYDAVEATGEEGRIVVTATRTPLSIERAPATVTVIDAEQIADELATDIRDLVRFEPGVTVRRAPARFGAALGTTGRARNEDFNIRGIGGNRVLIQVDGIRTPQGFSFGAQDAGRGGFTDVSLVKNVEILRGPASALYGSDGLAGAVSFTTSDPVDLIEPGNAVGGFLRAQYSSADTEFAETTGLAGQSGNLSAMAAFTRRDFQELDNQGTVGGIGEARTLPNPQDGYSNAALGKLVWQAADHRVRLTGEYLESELFTDVLTGEGPAFLFGPAPSWIVDDLTARDETERTRVSLDYTYSSAGDDGGFIDYAFLAAYFQDGRDIQFADEDRSPVGATPRPDRERLNTFENRVFGGVAEARSTFSLGGIDSTLAFGGEISVTRQDGLRDGVEPPTLEVFPSRAFPVTDFTLGGLFLANEFSLLDGVLTIFPALRFDFYSLDPTDDPLLPNFAAADQSDSRVSPKLGMTARLSDNVILFGNYAQGFRAPTPSQVNNFFENLAFGYTSLPNPDLGPETSESFEGGIRITGDRASFELVGFSANYDDFISQQVVGGSFTPSDPAVYQYVNFDAVEIEGIEAKGSLRLGNGINARFAMAYADGTIMSPGAPDVPLDTIEPLNVVLGLGYRAPDGRFGGELILSHNAQKELSETSYASSGSRVNICDGQPLTASACFRPESATVLDATAFFAVTDAIKLRVGLFNITDERYAYWSDVRGLTLSPNPATGVLEAPAVAEAFTRPGRNFSASISFNF